MQFRDMKYAVCANSDLAHSLGLIKRGDVFFVIGHTSLVSVLRIANTKLKNRSTDILCLWTKTDELVLPHIELLLAKRKFSNKRCRL
jgi:hypothetical protein